MSQRKYTLCWPANLLKHQHLVDEGTGMCGYKIDTNNKLNARTNIKMDKKKTSTSDRKINLFVAYPDKYNLHSEH